MSPIGVRGLPAAAFVLGLAACHGAAPSPASTPTPQTLAEALSGARLETGAPGAAAAFVRDGAVIFAGQSGDAARSPLRPLANTSLLSLAGVTEMATAAMVLQLEQAGRLTLDDPLARYVPYVPGADRITVRMLLAHRSGLPDYVSVSFDEILRFFTDPAHAWTRDEILRAIDPEDDLRSPGQGYRYSQTDYIALGAVVERASGASVEAVFEQLVAAPLGLARCALAVDPALAPDVAHGFAYASATRTYEDSLFPPNGSVPTHLWGPVWTDSGIMCSATDAARFTDALLGGRLVSPRTLSLMTDFGAEGFGLGVARKADTAHVAYGHAGTTSGYGAAAWYDPERRLTIVALVNAAGPTFLAGTVYERLDEAYTRGAR